MVQDDNDKHGATHPVAAGFRRQLIRDRTVLRDPASDELFLSPLSYGVAPFPQILTLASRQ
jgi:hypothetical protein